MAGRKWACAALVVGAAIAVGLVAGRAGAAQTASTVYTFSTATSEFYSPCYNQGWWGEAGADGNSDCNDDYYVGWSGASRYNDYFTFDISGFGNPCPLQEAYLVVPRGGGGGGASSVTYSLYDVTTNPATLAKKSNGPSQTIYNDLGSGVNYGSYTLSTSTGSSFFLGLNANALNAFHTAEVNHSQFFSIGGTLGSAPSGQYLFHATGSPDPAVTLTVIVSKLCKAG